MSQSTIEVLLQRLQSLPQRHAQPSTVAHADGDFKFMLAFDGQGAYVSTVNDKGKPILPDSSLADGERLNALRVLESIARERRMSISWDASGNEIHLAQYPHLLYQLLRCDNLVDKKMRPLAVCGETAELLAVFSDRGDHYEVSFAVMTDRGLAGDLRLINDQYVLTGQQIRAVKQLGEQYALLPHFAITLAKDRLATYLAALLTYIDNIGLHGLDYTIERPDVPLSSSPTLVFERVEDDMTLNMRLTTLAHDDTDGGPTPGFRVKVDIDPARRHITIRQLSRPSLGGEEQYLTELLQRCAPTRADYRSLYVERGEDISFLVPPATALAFLTQGLPSILGRYNLVGSDKLLDYKVKAVRPRLNVSIGSGIDFLEGTASVDLDGQRFTVHSLIEEYKKNRYITLTDGNRAIIDDKFMQRLERIFARAAKKDGALKISFFDLPEVETMLDERLKGEAVERSHRVFEGFNRLAGQRMRFDQVNAKLRNYQKEGVKWLNYLYENNLGGCLADDMGLGKTLQAITMLTRVYPKVKQPSLIVMPRSLLFNWESELRRFAPQLTFSVYYGPQRDLEQALQSQLVLTTYALVRNDIEKLLEHDFHYVILDESQNIKNVASQSTRAVTLLRAGHRLALSGTPIENNIIELYSLFRFLNPPMFGSLQDFNNRYTTPIQRHDDSDAAQALRAKVFPFVLRRLKRDVLQELPARTDQTITVEMSDEHKAFYESRRAFYETIVRDTIKKEGVNAAQFVMFQALSELRRAASIPESLTEGRVRSAKVGPLLDSLLEAVGNGHKAVVFFNFIAGIEMVGDMLTEQGIDYTTMTGSTNDRRAVVERFQNDARCMVLLMTLKTGGVGLNLTAADTVYIFEPWWNKAAEEQAINRLHRIGQKAKVLSYSIVAHDTIEDKIRQLQQRKADLADAIISSDTAMTKQLSEEDIRFILAK